MQWKTVYVFISSTFNDMHAERDDLVKRVFPELREWCAARKLRLVDIDLRWGVSEEDARENKRVVEICLNNIDRCRPFFLFFLGQRRGWVPGLEDINPKTLELFPRLKHYIGRTSVTEMEVIHAILEPMRDDLVKASHIRGYFRDPSYVRTIRNEAAIELYAPDAAQPGAEESSLKQFKKQIETACPCFTYTADWNDDRISHELVRFQGGKYAGGRFEHFRVGEETLEDHILDWLKREITAEYPDHRPVSGNSGSAREIDEQETAIYQAYDVYIPRKEAEDTVTAYAGHPDGRPFVIRAAAGSGKTSLLSHLYLENRLPGRVYMRLAGATARSMTSEAVVRSLLEQIAEDGLLDKKEIEHPEYELPFLFAGLLGKAAKNLEKRGHEMPLVIVVDAINQLRDSRAAKRWIPSWLPEGVSLIVSTTPDDPAGLCGADEADAPSGAGGFALTPMTSDEDRHSLISEYMGMYLKTLDDSQIRRILDMPGSTNPLYLKIVLYELRQFGSFDALMEKLMTDYGRTPAEAFLEVIRRLCGEIEERYPYGLLLLGYFLSMMAWSNGGIPRKKTVETLKVCVFYDENDIPAKDIEDAMMGIARELSPYLTYSEEAMDFRYDSFRHAVKEFYGDIENEVHRILSGLYLLELRENDNKKAAGQLCYHVVRESADFACRAFGDADVLFSILRSGAADDLVDSLAFGAAAGYEGFGVLERFFRIHADGLTVNPYTVFERLEADDRIRQHPVAVDLMESDKRSEPHTRLKDLCPDPYGQMMIGSYPLPSDALLIDAVGDHVVIVMRSEDKEGIAARVLDAETGRTQQIAYFRDIRHYRCKACLLGERLVIYAGNDDRTGQVISCCVPELTEEERFAVRLPEGGALTIDALYGFGDSYYGYFKRSEAEMRGWDTCLIRLNDSRVIRERRDVREGKAFAGRYLIIADNDAEEIRLFDILKETDVLAIPNSVPEPPENTNGIVVIPGMMPDAVEGDGWFLLNDGVSTRKRRNLKFVVNDGEPVIVRDVESDYFLQYAQVTEGRVFVRQSDSVGILDENLSVEKSLPYPIESGSAAGGKIVLRGSIALIFQKDRAVVLDRELFMAGEPVGPSLPRGFCSGTRMFFRQNRLYICDVPLIAVDLGDSPGIRSEGNAAKRFTFEPETADPGSSRLFGVMPHNNAFCLKDLSTLKKEYVTLLGPGEGRLEHAVENDGYTVIVKSGMKPVKLRAVAKQYSTEVEEADFGSVVIQELQVSYEGGRITSGSIESEWAAEERVLMMPYHNATRVVRFRGELYLIIINIFVDETTKRLRVYRLSDRKVIFSFSCQKVMDIRDLTVTRKGKLLFVQTHKDEADENVPYLIEVDLSDGEGRALKMPVYCNTFNHGSLGDAHDDCLWDSDFYIFAAGRSDAYPNGAMLLYDSENGRIPVVIEGESMDKTMDLTATAILHEPGDERRGLLFAGYRSRRLIEVYDIETGEFLFRQRIDGDPDYILTDAATGTVAVSGMHTGQRLYRLV